MGTNAVEWLGGKVPSISQTPHTLTQGDHRDINTQIHKHPPSPGSWSPPPRWPRLCWRCPLCCQSSPAGTEARRSTLAHTHIPRCTDTHTHTRLQLQRPPVVFKDLFSDWPNSALLHGGGTCARRRYIRLGFGHCVCYCVGLMKYSEWQLPLTPCEDWTDTGAKQQAEHRALPFVSSSSSETTRASFTCSYCSSYPTKSNFLLLSDDILLIPAEVCNIHQPPSYAKPFCRRSLILQAVIVFVFKSETLEPGRRTLA